MEILKGISASKGIAIAQGFIYRQAVSAPARIEISDTDGELRRLQAALDTARDELKDIYENALQSVGEEEAEIFHAQMLMVDDPDLLEMVEEKIRTERWNADAAFYESAESYAQMLLELPDEYFQARATDVRDIGRRIVRILQNKPAQTNQLTRRSIILAEDLAPTDTMQFDRALIAGFFTARGGTTSHTAILARALGIPAIVGSGEFPDEIDGNAPLILDGDAGLLMVNPDEQTLSKYQERIAEQARKSGEEKQTALQPAVTKDGKHFEVVSNIGNLHDAVSAMENGAEGVGLLRTEFSYIEQNRVSSEEEMVEAYGAIFKVFGKYPVVIRTLDIGGDKEVPHLKLPVEDNPFLGCRGIRLCFARPDLFRPQLRAILRAGVDTDLRIMFPMVAAIEEVRQGRQILNECMAELKAEGIAYNERPQVGIMIEVPSAAMCADQLAREVDFFSIGTNDLTQYTMAADRGNASVSYLVSALQPAVLRLIKRVIEAGHEGGIWVGMCGEMAGEPLAIPILLGFGLDEFSMNSPAIPRAKHIIRQWDTANARALSEQAIQCTTPQEVEALVTGWKV